MHFLMIPARQHGNRTKGQTTRLWYLLKNRTGTDSTAFFVSGRCAALRRTVHKLLVRLIRLCKVAWHTRTTINTASNASLSLRSRGADLWPVSHHLLTEYTCFFFFFFFTHSSTFQLLDNKRSTVAGVVPFSPRFSPSFFIAHRVQQSHCPSIFHRVLLTRARSRVFRKSICAQE